ncbi:MAG: bifunctional 2-C-methyl-D-erythritol 4-phosphate cytidylyltransferase/2-C-methyl-D-erythritol 2,4-cyclodiphosphate synthase [Alphaproteobacteria bacterium]|nr:bifunctional 2-C-methyl-D-erythritol 4-phosphate cytidylyltransferase/2-C-methyl-D-erythritol 2,4-cyclodiphosphate synthase [Alphaproteobacteria bacterium]
MGVQVRWIIGAPRERFPGVKTVALIVAAGRGTRAAASSGAPKQYADLAGRPLLSYAIAAFLDHPGICSVKVVIHRDDAAEYAGVAAAFGDRLAPPVVGGATRQESVLRGLQALAGQRVERVLIHDAARPFVSSGIIEGVLRGLDEHDGAIAAVQVADTLKQANASGIIAATVPRQSLWRAQTPQGFRFDDILRAHCRAAAEGCSEFTDDASIAEWAGLRVALTEGSNRNEKITTAEDLEMAQRLMAAETARATEIRTGTGFDVHRFAPGNEVWLCGVAIPNDFRLEGHSDADVGLHALTDSILGAIGDGDIGAHFPPSDPQWKGAASQRFLSDAARRVAERGGSIVNVDVTLLCELPKIGPHRDAMRKAIAEILELDIGRVGVKATTTEGLGFTGRREGIAAMASASVRLPIVD